MRPVSTFFDIQLSNSRVKATVYLYYEFLENFLGKIDLRACLAASPYAIIQKLQIKHAGGFWKWCRRVLWDGEASQIRPDGLFGSVRPAEENNQKGEKT